MKLKLDVIYEDNHLLVVNKPAMLATMGVKADQESLVTIAKQYLKAKYSKPGNVYLGVVSRLDSFVSGVIVMARTSKSAARLNKQFSEGRAKKRYRAIIPEKNIQQETAELVNWVAKDEPNHRMIVVEENSRPDAKLAKLSYSCLGKFDEKFLIEVELITGRKHQIRVQFSSIGCPVLGDRKYGSSLPFKSGIALHSHTLTVEHPTQKVEMSFQADPPEWWKESQFLRTN